MLKSKQKLLAAILRNPGIHVNALIKIVGSLRDIKRLLNELENSNLIYSKHVGNLRQLFPVLDNSLSASAFELVEAQEKHNSMQKFPVVRELANRIDSFKKIFGNELVSILMFGSVVRGYLSKESDVDVLFIAKNALPGQKNRLVRLCQTISLNLGREISAIVIKEAEFKRQLSDNASFASQVRKDRVILHGAKEFLSL